MKNKIFVGISILALTFSGFYATKANTHMGRPNCIYVSGLNVVLFNIISTTHLTTVKGAGAKTCYFATVSGILHTLYTTLSIGTRVYYKP